MDSVNVMKVSAGRNLMASESRFLEDSRLQNKAYMLKEADFKVDLIAQNSIF